jgi:hypothetical protein
MIKTSGIIPVDGTMLDSITEELMKLRFRIIMAVVFLMAIQFAMFVVLLGGISKNRYDISVLDDKTRVLSSFVVEYK